MRSYKRYTRRKRLLKHIVVVALVFILGLVLLRAVSYIAIQDEIPMINSFNLLEEKQILLLGESIVGNCSGITVGHVDGNQIGHIVAYQCEVGFVHFSFNGQKVNVFGLKSGS